jgi:hypothetical protein
MNLIRTSKVALSTLAVAGLCWFGTGAHADILPTYTGPLVPVDQGGGNFLYTYSVSLSNLQMLENGTGGTTQSFFTLYDVGGSIANINTTSLPFFTETTQNSGPIPTGTNGTYNNVDNAAIPNLVFKYTGVTPNYTGTANALGTFSFTSTQSALRLGEFGAQGTSQLPGNNQVENDGGVISPAPVPEPGSVAAFAVTGLFLTGLMWRNRRNGAGKATA